MGGKKIRFDISSEEQKWELQNFKGKRSKKNLVQMGERYRKRTKF